MGAFDHLTLCSDLTVEDVDKACASRESFMALLARLEQVSAPNTGCASILLALARLSSTACDWVDGDLAIELVDMDDHTEVQIMTELGGSMRERMFRPIRLRAPLAELAAALSAKPTLAGSLKVHRRSWKRITLEASEYVRRSTRPPRISEASLVAVRAPLPAAPPKRTPTLEEQVDAGWDEAPNPPSPSASPLPRRS